MQDAGIEITEMNSGCICCSLVGDFKEALKKVLARFGPERIIIEPSGVGKLSDVIRSVVDIDSDALQINCVCAVVDAQKCKMYNKNFGEFFNDQIKTAKSIVLSRTGKISGEKLNEAIKTVKSLNDNAVIVTTDWEKLDGKKILQAIESGFDAHDLINEEECPICHHHHDHDHEHHHGHVHEHECCNEHEHHHENEQCCEHDHHHNHEHEHCHEHEHHSHHHHADDVFTSWGKETAKKFTKEFIEECLKKLDDEEKYGAVLRAKGVVEGENGWIYFDHVPFEADVRDGEADITGRICVIGSNLNEQAIQELFGV